MSYVDLTEFDEMYDEAEVSEGSDDFTPIPDGTYQVIVDEVCIKETKKSQQPMLAWKLKIISNECKGRYLFKNSVITEKSMPYVKTDLSICGLKLDKFSDIHRWLKDLLDKKLEVNVSNKPSKKDPSETIQNIYFQKQIVNDDEVDESQIPF